MSIDRLTRLDQRIAAMRKRLESAERLREAIKDDPELLDLLSDAQEAHEPGGSVNGDIPPKRGRPKELTTRRILGGPVAAGYFKKVADCLEKNDNKPLSIPEMARLTGLKKSNLIQVCYRTHNILFEQHSVSGHASRKTWRLRDGWQELLEKESS